MSFHGNACKYNCNTNKLLLCTMKGWAWLSFATHISGRGRKCTSLCSYHTCDSCDSFFYVCFLQLSKLTQRSVPQLIFWLVRTVLFYWFCMVLVLQSDSPFQAQNSCNSHFEKWGRNWSTRWLWCTWNLESLELFGFEKFKFLTSLGLEHSAKHGSCWHLKMADSTNSKGAELSLLSGSPGREHPTYQSIAQIGLGQSSALAQSNPLC